MPGGNLRQERCREKKKRRRRKKGNGSEESVGGLWFARAGDRGVFFFGLSAWSVVIVFILKKSGAFVVVAATKTSFRDILLSFLFSAFSASIDRQWAVKGNQKKSKSKVPIAKSMLA